jgi:hypothetical protein
MPGCRAAELVEVQGLLDMVVLSSSRDVRAISMLKAEGTYGRLRLCQILSASTGVYSVQDDRRPVIST